jgi:hypothetical protein
LKIVSEMIEIHTIAVFVVEMKWEFYEYRSQMRNLIKSVEIESSRETSEEHKGEADH